jgi:hypothetical protein
MGTIKPAMPSLARTFAALMAAILLIMPSAASARCLCEEGIACADIERSSCCAPEPTRTAESPAPTNCCGEEKAADAAAAGCCTGEWISSAPACAPSHATECEEAKASSCPSCYGDSSAHLAATPCSPQDSLKVPAHATALGAFFHKVDAPGGLWLTSEEISPSAPYWLDHRVFLC